MSKAFLFLSVNRCESLLPFSASGHIPSLLLFPFFCCRSVTAPLFILFCAYAGKFPAFAFLPASLYDLTPLYLSVNVFGLLYLEGSVGISFTMCM